MNNITLIKGFADHVSFSNVFDDIPKQLWIRPIVHIYGKAHKAPRLNCWFGVGSFTYSGETYQAHQMPQQLVMLRNMVSNKAGVSFNSCLANLYRNEKDSVGYHSDNEKGNGPSEDNSNIVIASLSFGATRKFLVKQKGKGQPRAEAYDLEHGDLLIMKGNLQDTHNHSAPKTAQPKEPRLNLTFRVRI